MSSRPSQALLELVALVYEAAVDPTCWPAFLNRLAEAMSSSLTSVHGHDLANNQGTIAAAVHFDPQWVRAYEQHYSFINPFLTLGSSRISPGAVLTGDDVCPAQQLLRSEYFNDFMAPQDLFHLCGVVVSREGSWSSNLSTMRSRRAGPYSREEVGLLTALRPHLQRAFQVHRRLVSIQQERDVAIDALAHVGMGVILVDGQAHVLLANAVAQSILAANDGLTVRRTAIECASTGAGRQLRHLIGSACKTAEGRGTEAGGFVQVPRSSGAPLAVLVAPARGTRLGVGAAAPRAVLFLSDPEAAPHSPREALQKLYDLTPAESGLAVVLLDGLTVSQAAARLGISVNTAKTHAKRVYAKVGVAGQAQLIRRCANIPGASLQSRGDG